MTKKDSKETTTGAKHKPVSDPPRPGPVPDLKPGQYSDGHPLDEVQYLECKLILKPDNFTAPRMLVTSGRSVKRDPVGTGPVGGRPMRRE